MTVVPGHNQILQQSGLVQELNHQATTPKPSADQAAAQQQAQQTLQNTRVQLSEQAERLKKKKQARQDQDRHKQKKIPPEEPQDLDGPGRLLDTIA